MKIIKPSLLIAAGICLTTWAAAQEKTAKPIESAPPKPPMLAAPKEAPADADRTAPSPLKRDEKSNVPAMDNPTMVLEKNTPAATPGNAAQAKILAGAAETPRPVVTAPSTIDPKVQPAPVVRPVLKQQQNQ